MPLTSTFSAAGHLAAGLALYGALAVTASPWSHAEVTRPPAGVDVNETRVVSARAQMPEPCVAVVFEGAAAALGADARSVVLSWLENGRALVRDEAKGTVVPTVRVRYLGKRCGPLCGRGEIMVLLPEGDRPFLTASWWVS